MADDGVQPVQEATSRRRSVRKVSINSFVVQRNAKVEKREKVKKITDILKKAENERTAVEKLLLKKNPDSVKASQNNAKRLQATKDRVLEVEDEPDDLARKCDELAELIGDSSRIVVYTGAGISTAASIPDYRGPNGVWTLLKKGQAPSAQDLSDAEPTFTHMSITKLFRTGRLKHVVSQNCDGLHIRSGYPRYALSEVHGNMFIECCYNCEPHREYIRLFDVTEKTGVRRHTTSRKCRACGKYLTDTIVHFGEKGKIKSPYRWKEAVRAAKSSDLILCLGSSLKILKRYTCLWCMDKKIQQRPKLVIVNLQWTPKDDAATLKINGRCDDVMRRVMEKLEYSVAEYRKEFDPIFKFCTPLRAAEKKTTATKILVPPCMPSKASVKASVTKSSKSKRKSKQLAGKVDNGNSSSSSAPLPPDTGTQIPNSLSVKMETEAEPSSSVKPEVSNDADKLEKKVPVDTKDIKCEDVECKTECDVKEDVNLSQANEDNPSEANVNEELAQCPSLERKPPFSPDTNYSNFAQVNKPSDNNDSPECKVEVFPYQVSSTSTASKLPTDEVAIEQPDMNRSFSSKEADHLSPQVDKTPKQDSISLLLISQPPECLTDVCSLDLNCENPSVFPVCRIELPAVDNTTVLDSRNVSTKDKSQPVWDDSSETVTPSVENNLDISVVPDVVPTTVVVDLEMMESTGGGNCAFGLASSDKLMIDLDLDKWSSGVSSREFQVQSIRYSTNPVGHDEGRSVSSSNTVMDLENTLVSNHQDYVENISSKSIAKSPARLLQTNCVAPLNSALTSCCPISDHSVTSTFQKPKTLSNPSSSSETLKDKCHIFTDALSSQKKCSSQNLDNTQQHSLSPSLTSLSPPKTLDQPTMMPAVSFCNANSLLPPSQKPIQTNMPSSMSSISCIPTNILKNNAQNEILSLSSSSSFMSQSLSSISHQISHSHRNPQQNSVVTGQPTQSPSSSSLFMDHRKTKIIPKGQHSENDQYLANSNYQEKMTDTMKKTSESDNLLRNSNICEVKSPSDKMLSVSNRVWEKHLDPFKQANNVCSSTFCVPLAQPGMCSNSSKTSFSCFPSQPPIKKAVSHCESSNSGVASCVLNMDDLISSNPLMPSLTESKCTKLPEVICSSGSNTFSYSAPVRAFSPESQTPNQATTLVSKVMSSQQARSLEDGVTLSENTDIPFKEGRGTENMSGITDIPMKGIKEIDTFINTTPSCVNQISKVINNSPANLDPVCHAKKSDAVSWRCIQKPLNKRSQNRNTIVLKADWGTPLTSLLQDPPVTVNSKAKTCAQNGKNLKRPKAVQDNCPSGYKPSSQVICSDKDLSVPVKKRAKRTTQTKTLKKPVGPKKKKTVVPSKKNTLNPPTSLPGWFGKGLAIKRKKKS